MKDFILDEEIKNVTSKKTKVYLEEVLSTYYSGNYRSCVVVLYSVVVFDLINKLTILKDSYNDGKAKEILDDIGNRHVKNEKYSVIEKTLLEKICKETSLLNNIELKQLQEMKDYRNFAAHPVLSNNYELINPTKEQTLAHIRNMFEAIFLKDAILSRKIKEDFLSDMEDYYARHGIIELEEYLNGKYYSRFNDAVKKVIFKDLWSICFFQNDPQTSKNRQALLHALIALTKNNISILINEIEKDKEYYNSKIFYSKIDTVGIDDSFKYHMNTITSFVYFICKFQRFYFLLNDYIKIEIKNHCRKSINLFILDYFTSQTFEQHVADIKIEHKKYYTDGYYIDDKKYNSLDRDVLMALVEKSRDYGAEKFAKEFVIEYFLGSSNYFTASRIFQEVITPLLIYFNEVELNELIAGMDSNSQIYTNRDLGQFLNAIYKVADDREYKINYEGLSKINKML